MSLTEPGDVLRELVDEVLPLGPGADEGHVADEDVVELRELINAGLTDEAPYPGDAWVLLARPDRAALLLGVSAHRAELVEREVAPVAPDPVLHEEGLALGLHPDREHGQELDRKGQDDPDEGGEDVEGPLGELEARLVVIACSDPEVFSAQGVYRDLAGD